MKRKCDSILCLNTIDAFPKLFILESPLSKMDDHEAVKDIVEKVGAIYSKHTMRLITAKIFFHYDESDNTHARQFRVRNS